MAIEVLKAVPPVTDESALNTSMEGPKRIGMTMMFLVFVVMS